MRIGSNIYWLSENNKTPRLSGMTVLGELKNVDKIRRSGQEFEQLAKVDGNLTSDFCPLTSDF